MQYFPFCFIQLQLCAIFLFNQYNCVFERSIFAFRWFNFSFKCNIFHSIGIFFFHFNAIFFSFHWYYFSFKCNSYHSIAIFYLCNNGDQWQTLFRLDHMTSQESYHVIIEQVKIWFRERPFVVEELFIILPTILYGIFSVVYRQGIVLQQNFLSLYLLLISIFLVLRISFIHYIFGYKPLLPLKRGYSLKQINSIKKFALFIYAAFFVVILLILMCIVQ